MKKVILILAIVVLATTLFGQQYIVVDTTIENNIKLNVIKEGVQRIENTLIKVFDKEMVEKDTMPYLPQTREIINYFNTAITQYSSNFLKLDSLHYTEITTEAYQIITGQTLAFDYFLNGNDSTQVGLIHEWDGLNIKIDKLKNNPDITYLDAVSEFKKIQERQKVLESIYDKIKAQN